MNLSRARNTRDRLSHGQTVSRLAGINLREGTLDDGRFLLVKVRGQVYYGYVVIR